MKSVQLLSLLAMICLPPGCAAEYYNRPLQRYEPQGGYSFDAIEPGPNNSDSLFVCLTFSGGGTRASALAYGVLQELGDTPLGTGADGSPRSLLDEVDVISAVSGGSFTAMAYGLWGEELFDGHFEDRFLGHNVQRDLVLRNLSPLTGLPLLSPTRGNSDLAARYYHKRLFKQATYADLLQRGQRPFVVINATDMSRRKQFRFTQRNFNLLGSDLSQLPVSWAVAASSAFPLLLNPVRLKYYGGDVMAAAIQYELTRQGRGLASAQRSSQNRWASSLIDRRRFEQSGSIEIDQKNHRYLYLTDGGLVDNLGLTYVVQSLRDGPIRQRIEQGNIDRFVLIIVDAGTESRAKFERSQRMPGKLRTSAQTATSGMYSNTLVMTLMAQYSLLVAEPETQRAYEHCREIIGQHCPDAPPPIPPPEAHVDNYVIDVNFYNLPDTDTQERFLSLPTRFVLKDQDLADLIAAGRSLVRDHPEHQRLLADLGRAMDPQPLR